jgi:hypothetical protein
MKRKNEKLLLMMVREWDTEHANSTGNQKKKGGGGVYRVSSRNRIRMQSNQNQTQSPKERKMKKKGFLKNVFFYLRHDWRFEIITAGLLFQTIQNNDIRLFILPKKLQGDRKMS